MNGFKAALCYSVAIGLTAVITTSKASAAPGQTCADPVISAVTVQWEDGGGTPWASANPARLIDGNETDPWHFNGNPVRRIKLNLNGNWNISGVQYRDNWGDGQLVLDTDAINNGNQTTISTDNYPLGWSTESFSASSVGSVFLHTNGNVKINELQLCGTPANGGGSSGSSSSGGGSSGGGSSGGGSSGGGSSGGGSGGGGSCTKINSISANWEAGSAVPPAWQGANPGILVDGAIDQDWHYYWVQSGTPTAVVFNLNGTYQLSGIRWRDGFGADDMTLQANGQSLTVSTNDWPLAWQSASWSVGNVTSVSMTTSGNDVKVSEIEICGSPGNPGSDTIAPEPVTSVSVNASCTGASLSWPAAVDFDNSGNAGTASSYRIDVNGGTQNSSSTSLVVSNLAQNTSYSASIVAVDAAGNVSQPTAFDVTTNCSPVTDPWTPSINIIDSFGQVPVPDDTGTQWNAIRSYYNDYYNDGTHNYRDDGMCSLAVHNSYWVLAEGEYYPTWHPPVHNPGQSDQCWFMHDHGEDLRTSALYDLDDALSIGVPFGYAHKKMGNMGSQRRHEDHVGHKVVVQNGYTLVSGNPFGAGATLNEVGANCNWLSKVHQGSYSADALGNNMHEYFLNVDCEANPALNLRATEVRIKELVTWGYLDSVFDENCSHDWLWAGYDTSGPRHQPDQDGHPFSDGKREFGCFDARAEASYSAGRYAGQPQLLGEIWKPDGKIRVPDGQGSVEFSPYYFTRNPTRYIDPFWTTRFDRDAHPGTYLGRGCTTNYSNSDPIDNCSINWHCTNPQAGRLDGCTGTGAMVSSVDLCVRGSDAWQLSTLSIQTSFLDFANSTDNPRFCALLDNGLRQQFEQQIVNAGGDSLSLSNQRKFHPQNPYNGTLRGVHPKRMQVWQDSSTQTNYAGMKVFCTDAFGESSDWPQFNAAGEPTCPADEIMQGISPETNNWSNLNIDGSSVNASTAGGGTQNPGNRNEQGLRGGGEAGEFIIDGVAEPGNKVRAPN